MTPFFLKAIFEFISSILIGFCDDATFVLQLSKNEEDAEIKQKATEIESIRQEI
jgi:hypothetical protein